MEDYKSEDFPIEIDLGKEQTDYPAEVSTKKKGKPKTYYPSLYISDVPGLADIPKSGWALIEFERQNISINSSDEGDRASAELKVKTIKFPDSQDDDGSLADSIANALNGDRGKSGDSDDEEADE